MSDQKLLLLFLLLLPVMVMNAQQQFELTVKLPEGVDPDIIETWLNDGNIRDRLITPVHTPNGQLVYKGTYTALYASIGIQYKRGIAAKPDTPTNCRVFIQEKPAVVTLTRKDTLASIFEDYKLQNALDFKEEQREMNKYAAAEYAKAGNYEQQYGEQLFTGTDTAIKNYYFKTLVVNLARKQLEYVKSHAASYYSFYFFRTTLTGRPGLAAPDSLWSFFNAVFPDRFRYSDEGNAVKELLYAQLPARLRTQPINFVAKDIRGHHVELSSFQGKSYVLLHFWGTWCHGCIFELPEIKKMHDQYGKKGLQVISIGYRSAKAGEYEAAVKKYQLNWLHIYNDEHLINQYGNRVTPSLCLIDKTGKILYDSADDPDEIVNQVNHLKSVLAHITD